MAAAAPKRVLPRALRSGTAPTVASRLLQRLLAVGDNDIYDWVSGKVEVPADQDLAVGLQQQALRVAGQLAGGIPAAPVQVGAHLTGMPLNFQLTSRDAVLVEQTTSSAHYRLYALPGTVPPKPGLARVAEDGAQIIVELWDVPQARFGEFVAEIPPPLGIGNLELADGRWVKGFICEPYALDGARDITSFGGWRAFIAETKK